MFFFLFFFFFQAEDGIRDVAVTGVQTCALPIWRGRRLSLTWKVGDPSYAGVAWTVKNLFELKNAQRVLLDGNIFEHNWVGADQHGAAVLFTVRNQTGSSPWAIVADVTFTHNIVRHATGGIE